MEKGLAAEEIMTGVAVEIFERVWKIKNFDAMLKCILCDLKNCNDILANQYFIFDAGENIGLPCEWKASLIHNYHSSANHLYIQLALNKKLHLGGHAPYGELEVVHNLAVAGPNKATSPMFHWAGRDGIFTSLLIISNLNCSTMLAELDRNEMTLTLQLKFRLMTSMPVNKKGIYTRQAKEKQVEDMNNLFGLKEEADGKARKCDIEFFMTTDKKSLSVHKLILTARSPVFRRMIESGMVETETGIIKIEDLSSNAMKIILSYIYDGRLLEFDSFDLELLKEVAYGAEKYELPELLNLVGLEMIEISSAENAKELLDIAKMYNITDLEAYIVRAFPILKRT